MVIEFIRLLAKGLQRIYNSLFIYLFIYLYILFIYLFVYFVYLKFIFYAQHDRMLNLVCVRF